MPIRICKLTLAFLQAVLVLVESHQFVLQGQRGPHGTFWIIRVRNRGPEEHHHGVPDVLVDIATKPGDRGSQPLKTAVHHLSDFVGRHLFRHRGEAVQVEEEHTDNPQVALDVLLERRARRGCRVVVVGSSALGGESTGTSRWKVNSVVPARIRSPDCKALGEWTCRSLTNVPFWLPTSLSR